MCAHAREESARKHNVDTFLYYGVNGDASYRRTSYSTAAHGNRVYGVVWCVCGRFIALLYKAKEPCVQVEREEGVREMAKYYGAGESRGQGPQAHVGNFSLLRPRTCRPALCFSS